jgi:hypothetical protein
VSVVTANVPSRRQELTSGDAAGRSNERKKQQENEVADAACDLHTTRFYAAELVKALEYMHSQVRPRRGC